MRWTVRLESVGLMLATSAWFAACGGSTSKDLPSASGGAGTVSGGGGTGSAAGPGSSRGASPALGGAGTDNPGAAGGSVAGQGGGGATERGDAGAVAIGGALTQPRACVIGVEPSALEGCRAPNEANCSRCYVRAAPEDPMGGCTFYGGATQRDEYWAYHAASFERDCPAELPACAACSQEAEHTMCQETARLECDCKDAIGIDPCFIANSCECFCATFGRQRLACPPRD